jgi:hypothetical protein
VNAQDNLTKEERKLRAKRCTREQLNTRLNELWKEEERMRGEIPDPSPNERSPKPVLSETQRVLCDYKLRKLSATIYAYGDVLIKQASSTKQMRFSIKWASRIAVITALLYFLQVPFLVQSTGIQATVVVAIIASLFYVPWLRHSISNATLANTRSILERDVRSTGVPLYLIKAYLYLPTYQAKPHHREENDDSSSADKKIIWSLESLEAYVLEAILRLHVYGATLDTNPPELRVNARDAGEQNPFLDDTFALSDLTFIWEETKEKYNNGSNPDQ